MSDAAEASPVRAPLPTSTFVTSVARIEQLARPFTRVTFRGGDLVHFRSIGLDQFLYLLLPPAGRRHLTIDARFEWSQYQAMPESERPIGAYYTVRHHRPDVAELDIDIVKHGHEGQVGSWLKQARPGDPVALWGPRMAYAPPSMTGHQLLVGDETALPAIGAILEAGPAGERVDVIVELDRATVLVLPHFEGLRITRLNRSIEGRSALPAAVRAHPIEADTYVWGAGESALMQELKHHLRTCIDMPAELVSMVGYWRREAG